MRREQPRAPRLRLRVHACLAWIVWIALTGSASCGPETGGTPPLRLFAAASLADVVGELGEAWEARGKTSAELHFAGSNLLAQQLLAGAPADLFLSAGPGPMAWAVAGGAVAPESVQTVASNRLVVVAVPGTPAMTAAADLLAFDRLALPDPAGVPAGVYARAWLEEEDLWPRLEPRVVPTLDVRAALAAVLEGHLPAGVVYATDAAGAPGATVVYRVPAERTPPIRYLLGTVAGAMGDGAGAHPAVPAFRAFLTGAEGRAVFERHGFWPPPGEARP